MSLFDSVEYHYARHRPRLPDQAVQLLAHELEGDEAPTLLDLGAGTGQVALSMLPALPPTAHLDLVDQDPGMLRTALDELQLHLGEDRRAGTTSTYREPDRRYEDDLIDSAFSDITEHRVPFTRAWTARTVLGYLRSTSFAGPDLFTDHTAFEEQAHALLLHHAQDEVLREDGVFTVLLARRPEVSR
ncbi:methyltransferase [Streptomyces sp. NPDC096339]|uniref:methyltransferase n=1 Tax=Streptomyces sp. NPDC096339 TaxID=3366086 RepID=UPI0037FB7F90